MTRTTPELAPPLQTSTPHQREDVWPHRIYRSPDPLTRRRFFSGIGLQIWNPSAPRSGPRPPRPHLNRALSADCSDWWKQDLNVVQIQRRKQRAKLQRPGRLHNHLPNLIKEGAKNHASSVIANDIFQRGRPALKPDILRVRALINHRAIGRGCGDGSRRI
ncbi:hypothetical protein AVEN_210121-1 [Araneus ventricosus]|uniref:Uncharacterized protein n=1 Tax=Araneus ventricosus TaxID=182803 RepID=A0A4Y2LIV8_ARAVE|nr:hypothetical protein AVEN_91026-1 [Araneus ventricosus]GBN14474.1 hypothetical protein AVEN_210121-1 [Araneus ventricosus]